MRKQPTTAAEAIAQTEIHRACGEAAEFTEPVVHKRRSRQISTAHSPQSASIIETHTLPTFAVVRGTVSQQRGAIAVRFNGTL